MVYQNQKSKDLHISLCVCTLSLRTIYEKNGEMRLLTKSTWIGQAFIYYNFLQHGFPKSSRVQICVHYTLVSQQYKKTKKLKIAFITKYSNNLFVKYSSKQNDWNGHSLFGCFSVCVCSHAPSPWCPVVNWVQTGLVDGREECGCIVIWGSRHSISLIT